MVFFCFLFVISMYQLHHKIKLVWNQHKRVTLWELNSLIQDFFLELPSWRKQEFLGWREECSLPLKRLLQAQLMETRCVWTSGFPAGLLFILEPTLNSGMSCPFLWGWCARLVFSGGEHLGDVNINWIGHYLKSPWANCIHLLWNF